MEARWGHTGRGKFRGFKLHAAVNQLGLPLRALVTPGNCYDSPFLPKLIEDLEADYRFSSMQATALNKTLKLSEPLAPYQSSRITHAKKEKAAKLSQASF